MKLDKTLSIGTLALSLTFGGLALGAASSQAQAGTAIVVEKGAQANCGAGQCGAGKCGAKTEKKDDNKVEDKNKTEKKDENKTEKKDEKKGTDKGTEKKCGASSCGANSCG